jgi:hypothetical protein
MNKIISLTLIFFVANLGVAEAKDNYKTLIDEVTCGPIRIKIHSTCSSSKDREELNECKPQKIDIVSGKKMRSATLPEFEKKDKQLIISAIGTINELFVTEMGCTNINGADYAVLHYSAGGGSGPYSEFWTGYGTNGSLVSSKKLTFRGKEAEKMRKSMKNVRSIMPE